MTLSAMSPCQQEADTRMVLHWHHTAEQGHTKDSGHWCGYSPKISLPWATFDIAMSWIWILQDIKRNPNPPHLSTSGNSMLFVHAYKGCNVWHRQGHCPECIGQRFLGHRHLKPSHRIQPASHLNASLCWCTYRYIGTAVVHIHTTKTVPVVV
jgi:hypothetical protein